MNLPHRIFELEIKYSIFKRRYLRILGFSPGFNNIGFRTQYSFNYQRSRILASCIKFLHPKARGKDDIATQVNVSSYVADVYPAMPEEGARGQSSPRVQFSSNCFKIEPVKKIYIINQGRRNDIKSGGARFNGLNKVGILLTRVGYSMIFESFWNTNKWNMVFYVPHFPPPNVLNSMSL